MSAIRNTASQDRDGQSASASATVVAALVTEVFFDDPEGSALREVLAAAKEAAASLAVLPELPLNPWSPVSRRARPEDAEEADGPRQRRMAAAARAAGIMLAGGAIVSDPGTGLRHNTAFVYDAGGDCRAKYRKVHLPQEPDYWEASHYEPGTEPPAVVRGAGPLALGVQVCSDANRPQGFQILAAGGAEVVLVPRATPPESYRRWRMILRANAVMAGVYVLSVNRPSREPGVPTGGPSLAIDPFGEVIAEGTERLQVVRLERAVVRAARREYPGYLERFPHLYADGWMRTGSPQTPPTGGRRDTATA